MLAVENITKRFSGVTALEDVSLEIFPGKVTALLGENGAGKSTLMKILSGVYTTYEGRILYKNNPVFFSGTRDAQACGIAIIHQELSLIPHLSITENIFLGRELLTRWGMLDKKAMRARVQELLQKLKLAVAPETLICDLKVGQQQVVEIAKALLVESEVIIMDEPTSAISDQEVDVLFGIIDDLRAEGKAIVYISHKLDELSRIADRYIVLRDGRFIEAGELRGMSQDALICKMVGREIKIIRNRAEEGKKEELLRAEGLSLRHPVKKDEHQLKPMSFTLHRGEILGIFGLMGAGRTELLETLFGLHAPRSGGQLFVEGQAVQFRSPSGAIKGGLALVPEDRKQDGLVLGLDIKTNISLTTLADLQKGGLLDGSKELQLAKKYISELGIKTPSEAVAAKNLSGGNQQKVVLAKWLATGPKVLMLDEPTRGIDINAKNEIYKLILQLAAAGLGIIVVSSELPEILALSDRILVLCEGALTAELPAAQATENNILKAALPKTN
ncbi:sugar ABC transporter ATP-binding protein [Paraflavisolibacter sp. H34]|uniref:sugar ABC transporter ATP-binding protein n=1 Tax=Huijunlia imazamoxiresistens TaxID=3127457 RepID=UPI0030166817